MEVVEDHHKKSSAKKIGRKIWDVKLVWLSIWEDSMRTWTRVIVVPLRELLVMVGGRQEGVGGRGEDLKGRDWG